MVSTDAASLIFGIFLKTAFLLLFLGCLKVLFTKLAKTNPPVFKEAEKVVEIIYLPLGFAMIAFSLIRGLCSFYSVKAFGWLPLIAGLVFIAVGLVAVSVYHSGKTKFSLKNRLSFFKF